VPFLQVALDVPVDTLFDYRVPDANEEDVGRLVVVPFGRAHRVGVITAVSDSTRIEASRIRQAVRIARHLPRVPAEILDLARFCHRYYHHPLGEILLGVLPTALRRTEAAALTPDRAFRLTPAGLGVDLRAVPARATLQRRLLESLRDAPTLGIPEINALGSSAMRVLRVFMHSGWVEETVPPDPAVPGAVVLPPAASAHALNPEQSEAVAAIVATLGRFETHLLQGVTGSGKTEVYLQVIAEAVARGGQALLLVPEINLTPQLQARVDARFGADRVVSLHSGLAEGERLARWTRAARGDATIVVGTRLAVFTPMPRLAVIVVDEEHDASYKQQEGLRYHARDLAVVRGRNRGVPLVLGSATPSLESVRQVDAGRYRPAYLRMRAGGAAPEVRVIDTRPLPPGEWLHPAAAEAITGAIDRGEQSLVFINRRGYAPTLLCHHCGWVAPCHRCSARLTYHRGARRLRCHHCGHEALPPRTCPSCGSQDLRPLGQGTERVEEQLAARFPGARIARVDRDTTRRKDAFAHLRERIEAGDIDLLVGTQMLAKGHDFPRLTRVVVIGADQGLFSPDYRAEERLFALLLQVAGRAGRASLAGEVLVQTGAPEHPLYAALVAQNFDRFAREQLDMRRAAGFPPYVYQALLRAEAPDEEAVFDYLREAATAGRDLGDDVVLFDPVPPLVARVAGRWRGQLLVQGAARPALHRFLDAWWPALQTPRVRWSLDVDPLDF
jgi:primosomal protein N' (replication factor Y) (superfamily II helicase)